MPRSDRTSPNASISASTARPARPLSASPMTCCRSSVVAHRDATTPARLTRPPSRRRSRTTRPRSISIAAGMMNAAMSHRPAATTAAHPGLGAGRRRPSRPGTRARARGRGTGASAGRATSRLRCPSDEDYAPSGTARTGLAGPVSRRASPGCRRARPRAGCPRPPSAATNRSRTVCAGERDPSRSRRSATTPSTSTGRPATRKTTTLRAVGPLDDRAQGVGRRSTWRCGRRRTRTSAAARRSAGRAIGLRADRRPPVEVVRAWPRRRPRRRSRTPSSPIASSRAASGRGSTSTPGWPGRTAPLAGAVSVPSGSTVQPAGDLEVVVERAAAGDRAPRARGRPADSRDRSIRYSTASLFRPGLRGDQRVVRVVLDRHLEGVGEDPVDAVLVVARRAAS